MYNTLKKIVASIVASLAVILLYTILHEGGHALAAVLAGGRITAFDVNFLTSTPHIRYSGVSSTGAHAFIAIAGPIFPFLLWFISLGHIHRIRKHMVPRLLFLVISIQVLGTLLANAVLPIVHMSGVALEGEDVVKFLTLAGIHPVMVTLTFLALLLVTGMLAYRWLHPAEVVGYLKQIRQTYIAPRERIIYFVAALIFVIGATSVAMRVTSSAGSGFRFPEEYDTKLQVSFSGLSNGWNTLQEIKVTTIREYDFVYALKVNGSTTLRLVTDNPEGILYTDKEELVMCESATGLTRARFTGYALLPGNYKLQVMTEDKSGHLDMYISSRELDAEHLGFVTLLQELKAGLFDAEVYQDAGELIYQGSLKDVYDKVIYSLENSMAPVAFTVLLSGEFRDIAVRYVDSHSEQPIIINSRATAGFGITPRGSQGRLVLSSTQAEGHVFVYIQR